MNYNSMAIIILCSHLCLNNNVKPYEPSEWSGLAQILRANNIQPRDVLKFNNTELKERLNFSPADIERINRLTDRAESIAAEIKKYSNIGINIITRADSQYPAALKKRLGRTCPPILYYAGNLELLNKKCIGFVGSRDISVIDGIFTENIVYTVNKNGYGVVSGGARGTDTEARMASVGNGNICVEYISDSLVKRADKSNNIKAILNSQLIMLSAVSPDAEFSSSAALMRNKYIYAHSLGTVVVKSDYKRGGTWSGASNCLKNKYCTVFCWNNKAYEGNMELINMGAVPIDVTWRGNAEDYIANNAKERTQLSLFDQLNII